MRTVWLKSFRWILPFFLAGFLPVGASSPASSPEGGEGGTTAPSGETETSRPGGFQPGGDEREILSRMELLENLELLENMDLFEDFFLVVKEDEE